MADFPALPLWTDAYLADTRHLTTLEHGAYLLLLMEAWRRPHCNLPDDDALLARLAGVSGDQWEEIKPIVMAMWKHDGRTKTFSQKKLDKEKTYLVSRSKVQSDNATKRWNKTKKEDAMAMPNGCQTDAKRMPPHPQPTPTPPIKKNIQKKGPAKFPKPEEIDPQTWKDFEKHRQSKKAPITETAMKGFSREAAKCGWTLEQAITESIERGWRGFKAEWINNRKGAGNGNGNNGNGNGLIDACTE